MKQEQGLEASETYIGGETKDLLTTPGVVSLLLFLVLHRFCIHLVVSFTLYS